MRLVTRLACLAVTLLSCACAQSSTAPSGMGSPAAVAVVSGSCYPKPNAPCWATVTVQVTDSAGRVLPSSDFTYTWSGCASGTASTATCVLDRPTDLTAIVDARDNRRWSVRGTGLAQGVNRPPAPSFSDPISAWASGNGYTLYALSNDPDLPNFVGGGNCAGRRDVVAVGDCRFSATLCGGLTGQVIDVDLVKTAQAGMCTATLTITDEWGAIGTVTKSFTFPR